MTCAISLKAVNRIADSIGALWDQVALYEGAPSMTALNYSPHITLAVYEEIDPDLLKAALSKACPGLASLLHAPALLRRRSFGALS